MLTKDTLNKLTYSIIGAAIEVHKHLGPGLLESVYHRCMEHELMLLDIPFVTEKNVPVIYKSLAMQSDLRCDLLVDGLIPVELKAVDSIHPIHEAKLFTYMRLLEKPKGLLINFNCVNIAKQGQRTFVNEFFHKLENGY